MNRISRRAVLAAAPAVLVRPAFAADPPPAPDVSIALGKRTAQVVPTRVRCTHTGGGNIDVQQPTPEVLVVTMTGAAVAYGSPAGAASAALDFTLSQAFEVSFDKPTVKAARLTLECRLVGFLRSHKLGTAEVCGSASVGPGLTLAAPARGVAGGESLSVNDKDGPVSLVLPSVGALCLTQQFRVSAAMPKCLLPCKAPSAEFAPDPALDPLWISAKEPFRGAKKADLGFQVTLRVAAHDPAGK